MDKIKQLKKNLKSVLKIEPNYPVVGYVTKIEDDTCWVQVDDLELTDIKLKSSIDGSDSFLVVPAINSHITMISLDGSIDNMTVIKIDKVQKITWKQNGLEIIIDSDDGKLEIKNKSISLKELFEKSAEIKKKMKVSTPMGPSGTPLPDVIQLINDFETSFKQLLK